MILETLVKWAEEEIAAILRVLPEEVSQAASAVPATFEAKPGDGPHDDELTGDELGLFEGTTAAQETDPAALPRIRLFLANLWQWVEEDEQDFRDEVGITYLHELGHYLGWEEEDIAERGLD